MTLPTPQQIKTARQAAGLTQAAAAQLVGVLLRSWQRWESGERKISATAWKLFKIKTERKMDKIDL